MDFSKVRNYLFLGLLLLVTILFLYTIRPFAYPMFWAAVLAALSHPLYIRLDSFLKHKSLSALITLIAVTLIILLPLTIIGTLLVRESVSVYAAINNNQNQFNAAVGQVNQYLQNNPWFKELHLNNSFITEKAAELGRVLIGFIFNVAKDLTQNSLTFLVMFIIMLYTLFFFIRDGKLLLKKIMHLCPLGDRYEKMLYDKFSATASAMIRGTLLVGSLQGLIGGLLFAFVGIPSPLIWGILMAAFSIIPATGSFLVWFPAALVLIFTGNVWQGVLVLIIGAGVISTIDNLLRPVLVGKDLRMHPLIILFTTLGGIALFGISGFIIGPIVAALFLSFWEMYEHYYNAELSHN